MTESDEYHQTASAPSWPCLECKILTVLYVRCCFEDMMFSSDYIIPMAMIALSKGFMLYKQHTNRASAEILWNYCQFYVAVMFLYGVSWGRICSWWCQVSFFFLFTLYTRCLFCVLVQRKVRPDMFPFRLLWWVVGTLLANERSRHLIPAQGFEKAAATTTSSMGINRTPTQSNSFWRYSLREFLLLRSKQGPILENILLVSNSQFKVHWLE